MRCGINSGYNVPLCFGQGLQKSKYGGLSEINEALTDVFEVPWTLGQNCKVLLKLAENIEANSYYEDAEIRGLRY